MSTAQVNATAELDLNLDVATLLREGTAVAHAEAADNTEAAGWLSRGELDKDEYIRFLIVLWHIYSTFEEHLERHSSHPVLAPTYNPTLLSRAPALSSDIAYLLETSESEWHSHPLALSVSREPPAPLTAYIERIRTVSSPPDPSGLLAHAYVRYLGDLSGGQIIRRRVTKAYNLDPLTGLGTQFYDFQKLGGGGVAGIGDMSSIKMWYREGLNKGVGDDRQRKAYLVSEANVAFRLNGAILDILKAPTAPKAALPVDVALAETKPQEQRMVSVAGVLSFVLAMGIAHFVLVTGGFLGDAGLNKLDRAREWLSSAFAVPAVA